MKRGTIWILLTGLMVMSLVLASCTKSTTSSTITSNATSTSSTASATIPASTLTTSTTATTAVVTTTVTNTGHWWDSLGTPLYGGEITIAGTSNVVTFDPYNGTSYNCVAYSWLEQLFTDDWTMDPSVFAFQMSFRPPDYAGGCLAKSWEFTNPTTVTVHLRQGVHWQNLPPVNGREFTSADVLYHYDRMLGLGNGFTKVSPYWSTNPWVSCTSITAPDKYTVVFSWPGLNPESIAENMQQATLISCMEASEAVTQWGNVNDWHHAIGTGPFILTDFVPDSSLTMVKNQNYWGYDECYPQNQIPYVEGIHLLIVPNSDTALAALRTGKLDRGGCKIQQLQGVKTTNPELKVIMTRGAGMDVDPRDDTAPFNNINVRIALQKALNLPLIASTYYLGTADPTPQTLTTFDIKGWGWPYSMWPQSLKDEYSFDQAASKKLLADAGYANLHTYIACDSGGDMDLISIIQSQFAAVGITMDILSMDSASLNTYLLTAHKNTALAIRGTSLIGRNLAPLRVLTEFQTGDQVNYVMWNDPVFNAFAPAANAATSIDAIKAIDQQANEYVARNHIVISLCTTSSVGLCQPWLNGWTGQTQSFGNLSNTYLARFWIDQSVKKSLGH